MFRSRNRNRKRPERELPARPPLNWRRIAIVGGGVAISAGVYAAAGWMLNRPIETVVINGAFQRVSAIQIEGLLEPAARVGFLNVDLLQIKRELVALPWVARANVRRKWPGTLEVNISEEKPVACWGEKGLLNQSGELFVLNAEHVPAELPRLSGPQGTEGRVTERFFNVQEQLEHRGLSALAMSLDGRGAWSFQLSSGMQVRLGAQDVDARINRFFHALDTAVGPVSSDVNYVDMRYPNGFAIGWKSHSSAQAAATETFKPHA